MSIYLEMFWVLGGTPTVCRTLFHNWAPAIAKDRSPTVEHWDWRTSRWSASDGRSTVWTAYQTNGADLQPGSEEPYRPVNDRRLSPAWSEHAPESGAFSQWKLASVSVMWSERRGPAMDHAASLSHGPLDISANESRGPSLSIVTVDGCKPTSTALP